jgi:SusD family.
LIYAEAKIQTNQFPDGMVALNRVRTSSNVAPYAGAITQTALINEVAAQRRYSLFYEGHRWVGMSRWGRLGELPKDRQGDDVWDKMGVPE